MTTTEPPAEQDDPYLDQPGQVRRRNTAGCVAVLVALAVVVGLGFVVLSQGRQLLEDLVSTTGTDDYSGPGQGSVTFRVRQGDSVAQIGRNLKAEGVTASVDAFISAARDEERSEAIQVGYYELQKRMPAADALEVLVDPDNLLLARVTVPEGLRVTDTVDLLAKETEFSRKRFRAALDKPKKLGLPSYANGNPEGYLFPSTYDIGPKDGPVDILSAMVDRWRRAAEEANLDKRAKALGHTPAELMIIASLIQAEGRGKDMPKISRVIYNRLDGPGDKGGTNGLLQIDAANAYGIGKSGTTALTEEELAEDTPYNTRKYPGLPPTPIEAPGQQAIEAAANPADGDWYYYVTVNLRTGKTKFYETYQGFLRGRQEYQDYCTTSDAC